MKAGKNEKEGGVGEGKRRKRGGKAIDLRDGFEPPLVESESTVIATTLTEEGMCRKPSVTIHICNKRMKSETPWTSVTTVGGGSTNEFILFSCGF